MSATESGCVGVTRPRLLVITSTYPRWAGDPEPAFVHELSRRLAERFDVVVLGPHAKGALAREQFDGVEVVRYRYAPQALEMLVNDGGVTTNLRRRPWAWLLVPCFVVSLLVATVRQLRQFRPQVVHAHWLIPQGVSLAMLSAWGLQVPPFVVTSHGADLFALRGKLATSLKRWALRRASGVTVVSAAMRDQVIELGADPGHVQVEPMGVDLETRFREDPAVQRSDTELLFVGRLVEKKGLSYLLDAMPRVLGVLPDARLTVVGFGPEEEGRRSQVRELGIERSVEFVGAVSQSDLPQFYRRAAIFVAPFVQATSGDQEGLGLVLVEAVGCGCPVIVTDLPATRDLGPERPGLTRVRAGDSAALADAIIAMLSDPRRTHELPDVSRFAWTRRAASYIRLLESLQ